MLYRRDHTQSFAKGIAHVEKGMPCHGNFLRAGRWFGAGRRLTVSWFRGTVPTTPGENHRLRQGVSVCFGDEFPDPIRLQGVCVHRIRRRRGATNSAIATLS
jgi:hypothetical protein